LSLGTCQTIATLSVVTRSVFGELTEVVVGRIAGDVLVRPGVGQEIDSDFTETAIDKIGTGGVESGGPRRLHDRSESACGIVDCTVEVLNLE
jgi:hypothetical protein